MYVNVIDITYKLYYYTINKNTYKMYVKKSGGKIYGNYIRKSKITGTGKQRLKKRNGKNETVLWR
jgi:hypothetical protein